MRGQRTGKGLRPGDLPFPLNRNAVAKKARRREAHRGTAARRPAKSPEIPRTWFPLGNRGDIFGNIEAGWPRPIRIRRTQINH